MSMQLTSKLYRPALSDPDEYEERLVVCNGAVVIMRLGTLRSLAPGSPISLQREEVVQPCSALLGSASKPAPTID